MALVFSTAPTCRPGMLVTMRFTASINFAAASSASCRWLIGRGAGVICEALNSHIPPMIADDSFHYADIDLLRSQRAALLDMQFEIGENIPGFAAHGCQMSRIPADEGNPLD